MNLPEHVYAVRDRHGRTRYRFVKKGLASRYLRGLPGSAEFVESYDRRLDPSYRPARRTPTSVKVAPQDFVGRSCVYFIGGTSGPVKIGTTVNLPARLKKLQTGSPRRLMVLACVDGGAEVEAHYHAHFASLRVNGEWFEGKAVRNEVAKLQRAMKISNPRSLKSFQPNKDLKIHG